MVVCAKIQTCHVTLLKTKICSVWKMPTLLNIEVCVICKCGQHAPVHINQNYSWNCNSYNLTRLNNVSDHCLLLFICKAFILSRSLFGSTRYVSNTTCTNSIFCRNYKQEPPNVADSLGSHFGELCRVTLTTIR